MKRKSSWRSSGSAEQPADGAPEGSAEHPAHRSADHNTKRRKCDETCKLQTSVGYLSFPSKNYTTDAQRRQVIDALRKAKDSDLNVIHMGFARDDDIINMWSDLEREIETTSSVEQPAHQYRREGNLLSVWSEKLGTLVSETNPDSDEEAPAIGLTFDTPAGRMSTINSSCSTLSRATRRRLLAKYVQKSTEPPNSIHLIGGELGQPMVIENLVSPLDSEYELTANDAVCAFAKSSDGKNKCCGYHTDYSIAHAVVIQFWHDHASAVDSDVHPVKAKSATRKRKAHQASDSDVHPVHRPFRPRRGNVTDGMADSDAHPAQSQLTARTPLWDNVLAKLDQASSSLEGQQLMKFIEEKCFFGKLCYKNAHGEDLEKPMRLTLKMEILLSTAAERRNGFLKNLCCGAEQPALDMTHIIAEEDMKNIFNHWRWDADSWMSEKNLKVYKNLLRHAHHDAQKMAKQRFNVYKFHLSGCTFLLHKFIQLPIIAQCNAAASDSAEQPVSIMKLISDLRVHMESDEYKAAVKKSRKKASDHKRLSKQIRDAQWYVGKGKELSMRALKGEFFKLSHWERKLVEQYDGGKLERNLKDLLAQQTQVYKGVGASVQLAVSLGSAVQPAASSSSAIESH